MAFLKIGFAEFVEHSLPPPPKKNNNEINKTNELITPHSPKPKQTKPVATGIIELVKYTVEHKNGV